MTQHKLKLPRRQRNRILLTGQHSPDLNAAENDFHLLKTTPKAQRIKEAKHIKNNPYISNYVHRGQMKKENNFVQIYGPNCVLLCTMYLLEPLYCC